ncbi:elongin BC and Polycomb repressive complex 2-associated protein [Bufo gargarizans]|uniref:elongin BC and Polycomb repressive complex 2-associated protein n=1 Tax=Bufo gargarizans TaxID=30331 RepID=UPI001CF5D761|nr:elongin BC and Polycomb repressive complex 2-associated protein [Bufo gargarizans]
MEPRAGYQEIAGTRMGYLHVGGRQLFALAEVLSGPLRGVPRGRVCRRMERLHIQSRRCDLRELRALKALRSVPSRAVQCCLISREDLHVLCSSSWGPNTVIPKEWMQVEGDAPQTPQKECVPSRMRAAFPPELVDIFPSALHSPATSVGYSSPSDSTIDQTSFSDTESDSSGDVYRSVEINKISRQIITRSRDCRDLKQPVKDTHTALQISSPTPPHESKAKEPSEDKMCVTQECGQSPKIAEDNEEEASLPPEEEDHDEVPQSAEPEPRVQQFDRLVRQSKLWCYARGFRTDLRDLHPAITRKCSKSPGSKRPGRPKGKGLLKKKMRKKLDRNAIGRRSASNLHAPVRPPFSFLGNFPAPPSLVVGEDGDLCPAYSLNTQDQKAVPRTHPVWGWNPGGNAIPLPPSLKFRAFPKDHL